MVSESFYLQRAAIKFSANIISATVYLFVENPGLRGTPGYRGVVGAAPYMVVRNSRSRGVENAAVSRRPLQGCTKILVISVYLQTK